MFTSALALALHIPVNFWLSKAKGLEGISIAVSISDFVVAILLGLYVLVAEQRKGGNWKEGGWFEQRRSEWVRLIKLSGPCCLTTCLEWWCYEILVLLTGRLPNAKQSVGVLAIVLNFDYLLFSVMLSLSTCSSIRVSNELGARRPEIARRSAYVSLFISVLSGFVGGSVMALARGVWGPLYSRDEGIVRCVKRMMVLMAIVEVVNFPLAVCGGVVRGTARPWLGMYANVVGFYLVALPLGVVLAFKMKMGLAGLLMGFLGGVVACLVMVLVFVMRMNWDDETERAQIVSSTANSREDQLVDCEEDHKNHKPLDATVAL